jgi:hypothetical protein
MGYIGRLISTRIDNYILGVIEKKKGYNLESSYFGPAGIDARPLPEDKQYCGSQDGSEKYVVLGSLMISKGAKEGELILYSRDSDGNVKSKVYLKNDGKFYFNDGDKPAARKEDEIKSTSAEDSAYWTFWSAMFGIIKGIPINEPGNGAPSAFQAALAAALVATTPSSLTGKITAGTEEVLLP